MKKAGVKDYKEFALKLLSEIKDKPISFEVFSDEIPEMEKQAYEISKWGKNVNVKIPVTNTKKERCYYYKTNCWHFKPYKEDDQKFC